MREVASERISEVLAVVSTSAPVAQKAGRDRILAQTLPELGRIQLKLCPRRLADRAQLVAQGLGLHELGIEHRPNVCEKLQFRRSRGVILSRGVHQRHSGVPRELRPCTTRKV